MDGMPMPIGGMPPAKEESGGKLPMAGMWPKDAIPIIPIDGIGADIPIDGIGADIGIDGAAIGIAGAAIGAAIGMLIPPYEPVKPPYDGVP
jgi:hypothetical protein